MKSLIFVFLFITTIIRGQDCSYLNELNRFHGLRFGESIPDSLLRSFWKSDNTYFLDRDSIKTKGRNYLEKFFKFTSDIPQFSLFAVTVGGDKKVYSVYQSDKLSKLDSLEITVSKLPSKFKYLLDEIRSMVGKETRTEKFEKNNIDNFWSKIAYIWECEKNRLELSLTYDGVFDGISVEIINIGLERLEKIRKIKD